MGADAVYFLKTGWTTFFMTYRITRFSKSVLRITLTPPIEGFDQFICAWVMTGEKNFLVDPGPAATVSQLRTALAELGLDRLDAILLTHIHIDHAGGIGEIAAAFPAAPVVCHEAAVPHLVDPEKLWQGTVKTLGKTARAYGPISPVPRQRLIAAEQWSENGVWAILTPGHAVHHVSYLAPDGILFAGEAGGVNIDFGMNRTYLRPATPPRFDLEISAASIDRLLAEHPATICYGHTACRPNAVKWLQTHQEQLYAWEKIIAEEIREKTGETEVERCAGRLLAEDPLLTGLADAPAAAYRRERFFMNNSIRGFIGILRKRKNN